MKSQTYQWDSKATKGVKPNDRKKSEPVRWAGVPGEIIEQLRGRAAQAWCKPSTSSTEMDCDLAEEFAHILEQDTRAWRNQVETLVCVIEELLPLIERWSVCSDLPPPVNHARAMVIEYRKQYPKSSSPQSPSGVAKRS